MLTFPSPFFLQTCLAKCMDRYLEAWNHISRVYAGRLQRDANH